MSEKYPNGVEMFRLAEKLWPLNRSLTGEGTRATLEIIRSELPKLEVRSVPSGFEAFDWQVPQEWAVEEAYVVDPEGQVLCEFEKNNLHLVGYSCPFEGYLSLQELQKHLYSLEAQPEAIPYVTSYYKDHWGFCLSHSQRLSLKEGLYYVKVKSKKFDGQLNYGELFIPGKIDREVFFSTYVCHPSMANNELSGPVLAVELAKLLLERENHFSYRFVFLPETIGSLVYMAKNLERMKKKILAGYVLTCVGDERAVSYLPSRSGDSVADKVARLALGKLDLEYLSYSWLDRGSDERQYCSPGADLPICSVMRSKYGADTYPEYHTHLDKLGHVVTEKGLQGTFEIYQKIILEIEGNRYPLAQQVGEPQLSRRNLYPTTSNKGDYSSASELLNILSLADGQTSIHEIENQLPMSKREVEKSLKHLEGLQLIQM